MSKDYAKALADIKKKTGSSSDRLETLKFEKNSKTRVRVVPGHPNMDGFFIAIPHHDKGEGSDYVKLVCHGEGCPIDEELQQYRGSKDKDDQALLKAQQAKDRYFFNVLVRSEDNEQKAVECGVQLIQKVLEIIINDEDYGDVLDPHKGRDIIIIRDDPPKGQVTYNAQAAGKESPMFPEPETIDAFIGTNAKDTKITDLTTIADQFKDEPDKLLLVWNEGWKALKDDKVEDTKSGKTVEVKKSVSKTPPPPDEDEETPAITSFPVLKMRDPITGDVRYKTPDGIKTADGKDSPKGLAEGARPSKPSKAYLKDFPEPIEEVEAEEEVEEAEEEETQPVLPKTVVAKKAVSKPAVVTTTEDDDDEGLEDLDQILKKHGQKGKK